MISQAKARFTRISTRKARMVIDLVRGRNAAEAMQLLEFTPKAAAPIVRKLIASAVANARQVQPKAEADDFVISHATVDKASTQHLRRWRPRAMGRATRIEKGASHICIQLDET